MDTVDYSPAGAASGRTAAVAVPLGWTGVVAWAVIVLIVGGILAIGTVRSAKRGAATRPVPHVATAGTPAANVEVGLSGRMAVAMATTATAANKADLRATIDKAARLPADRLRAAVVARELDGPAAGLAAVDAAAPAVADDPRLRADADALHRLYAADRLDALSAADRASLAADLDYFGRLAATQGNAAGDKGDVAAAAVTHQAVVRESRRTTFVLVGAGVAVVGIGSIGLALLATAIVLFAVGTLRPAYRPAMAVADRPVWLEAFALWLALFVIVEVGLAWLVGGSLPIWAGELALTGVTATSVGWAAWRGRLDWAAVRRTLGWDGGRHGGVGGVLAEVGLGAAGYVAGLPVVAAGIGVTFLLTKLSGVTASHPIVTMFHPGMTVREVAVLLAVAAVGAPVLEETMFRGALYAHLRARHAAWLSAGVVAVIFAGIHPQGWVGLPVLASIALVLAALREWRGSLVAPMTAHAINNGSIVMLMVLALG